MPEGEWRHGAWLAEFVSADAVASAIDALHARGFAGVASYLPWDASQVTERLTDRPPSLPRWVFVGAVVGALVGYLVQWYANVVSYPLDIGGRPAHAVPSFVVATFEGAVLAASLTAFLGCLASIGLPALWHPVFEVPGFESATRAGYWLAVDAADAALTGQDATVLLRSVGAHSVRHLEGWTR